MPRHGLQWAWAIDVSNPKYHWSAMASHGQQATTRMKRVALLAHIKSRGLVPVLVWFGGLLGENSGEQKIQVDRKSPEKNTR